MESPLVLILDFDGVLVNLGIDWVKVRKEVSNAIGREIYSLNDFWETHFQIGEFEAASRQVERHELDAIAKLNPKDISKLKKTLERAVKPHVTCYIASLQSEAALNRFLDVHGLAKYFKAVLGRCTYGSKRNQLEHIMKQEGGDAKLVMIDDSKAVCRLCEELGIKCILFERSKDDLDSVIMALVHSSKAAKRR